jgi:disulfide bond formation protein DsbB
MALTKPDGSDRPAIWILIFTAWAISLAATLGALFVGEVMGQAPCALCWFQRAFMFPLAVILLVGCWRNDAAVGQYALPLAAIGSVIAAYQTLQHFGVVSQALTPCGSGPSCSGPDMTIFGGVPLPLLSLGAFSAIGLLLLVLLKRSRAA